RVVRGAEEGEGAGPLQVVAVEAEPERVGDRVPDEPDDRQQGGGVQQEREGGLGEAAGSHRTSRRSERAAAGRARGRSLTGDREARPLQVITPAHRAARRPTEAVSLTQHQNAIPESRPAATGPRAV